MRTCLSSSAAWARRISMMATSSSSRSTTTDFPAFLLVWALHERAGHWGSGRVRRAQPLTAAAPSGSPELARQRTCPGGATSLGEGR